MGQSPERFTGNFTLITMFSSMAFHTPPKKGTLIYTVYYYTYIYMSYHCFAMDSTVESSPPKCLCEIVGVVSCSGPVRHRPPVELHGPSRMDPSLLPKFRLLA